MTAEPRAQRCERNLNGRGLPLPGVDRGARAGFDTGMDAPRAHPHTRARCLRGKSRTSTARVRWPICMRRRLTIRHHPLAHLSGSAFIAHTALSVPVRASSPAPAATAMAFSCALGSESPSACMAIAPR